MNKRTAAIGVFVILCSVCVVHALYYYPRLPEQVARHFNASGQPGAKGNKMQFLVVYLATVGIMAAVFLGFGFLLPKVSNSAFNLPNKDYWLAPERRQQTLDSVLSSVFWLGSMTMLLLLDIFHQSVLVHLGKTATLGHFWISLSIYLAITVWVCIAINRKFNKREL